MNKNKTNRPILILMVVLYSISIFAGSLYGVQTEFGTPEYGIVSGLNHGWKGTSNGVDYELVIYKLARDNNQAMLTNEDYYLSVICVNDKESVPKLNVALPEGFIFVGESFSDKMWPWIKNWTHYYHFKSTAKPGIYEFAFTGKDASSRMLNFSVPLPVVEDLDKYALEEADKKSVRERTVTLSPGQQVTFPKGFESVGQGKSYFAILGGILGLGLAINSQKDNMAALIPIYDLMIGAAGIIAGALPGLYIDSLIYKNSDVCWVQVPKEPSSQKLVKREDVLYFLDKFATFFDPASGTVIGEISQGEFRQILGSKSTDDSIWYKVKKKEIPLF